MYSTGWQPPGNQKRKKRLTDDRLLREICHVFTWWILVNNIGDKMKLIKINMSMINGTGYMGKISLSYNNMVEIFGEPHNFGFIDDKTDVEWFFKIDNVIVTIYNWKDGQCYLGNKGLKINQLNEWHIGGKSKDSLKKVNEYIRYFIKTN